MANLSQAQYCLGWLAFGMWLLVYVIISPLLLVCWLFKKALACLAEGFGARLLLSNDYDEEGLCFSAKTLHRWFGLDLIEEGAYRGMQHLLDDSVRKCWVETLNVIIIVSGLLTTSSYQALYAGFLTTTTKEGLLVARTTAPLLSCFAWRMVYHSWLLLQPLWSAPWLL